MSDACSTNKKDGIVNAARKRFAHYGLNKVTMEEIAGDVEMGKASLYYYFPTKESVFEAVVKVEQNQFIYEIENIIKQKGTARQKFIEYVQKRLKYFQELLNLGTLNVYSFMDAKSLFKQLFKNFELHEAELIKKIIDEGKDTGEFKKNLDNNTAIAFLHMLQGLRLRTLPKIKGQRTDKKTVKELRQEMMLVTEIFLNGISN